MGANKILYIEDDLDQIRAMRKFLDALGIAADVFDDPAEALRNYRKNQYRLIITDIDMPGINGIDLCRKIRAIDPETIIYALSGHVAQYRSEALQELGFSGHLCKPVIPERLEQAIQGALERSRRNHVGESHE